MAMELVSQAEPGEKSPGFYFPAFPTGVSMTASVKIKGCPWIKGWYREGMT